MDIRIRKCYSLLESNSYTQVKEEIAYIVEFALSSKSTKNVIQCSFQEVRWRIFFGGHG